MSTSSQSNPNLKKFLSSQSEDAFRELVSEYGGLVFSSALRRTGERELAEEVTQSVFAILARKAASAVRYPSLTGWLFTVTKLESSKAMRTRHRHQRKIAALAVENPQDAPPETWQDTLPHLDDLLDGLPKLERELLLARYVEEKPYQALARESGKSEAACKMRIKRTLEKLRTSLTARGATVSVTTLSLALSSELSRALPVSLATSLPTQALATATSLKTGSLVATQLIHAMNTVKTSTIALAVIALGSIPVSFQHASAMKLRRELATLQEQGPAKTLRTRLGSQGSDSESSPSNSTPIARFLAKGHIPATGEEFLEILQGSMLEQNHAKIIRIIIALSGVDRARIESLIAEVEACEKYAMAKGAGLQMLLQLSGETKENPGKVMERTIASGLVAQNLEGEMDSWLKDDPEAALAWFREKLAKGTLVGKGLRDSPEAFIAAAVVRTLVKTDRQAALALVDKVDPLNRATVIDALVPGLLRAGRESWPEVQGLIVSMTDIDDRMETLGCVGATYLFDRSEVRQFLDGMNLRAVEASQALANVASVNVFESYESVTGRMAWLLETAKPAELREAVKRTIEPLAKREPAEVTAWIESLEQGAIRDAALSGQTASLMWDRKYEKAMNLTKMISDPAVRDAATTRIRNQIEHENPNGKTPQTSVE